jgi:hypothetical protein
MTHATRDNGCARSVRSSFAFDCSAEAATYGHCQGATHPWTQGSRQRPDLSVGSRSRRIYERRCSPAIWIAASAPASLTRRASRGPSDLTSSARKARTPTAIAFTSQAARCPRLHRRRHLKCQAAAGLAARGLWQPDGSLDDRDRTVRCPQLHWLARSCGHLRPQSLATSGRRLFTRGRRGFEPLTAHHGDPWQSTRTTLGRSSQSLIVRGSPNCARMLLSRNRVIAVI